MTTVFTAETYFVRGMSCTGCETVINNVLLRMDGIEAAEADFAKNTVRVTYDAGKVSLDNIREALKKEGYFLEDGSREEGPPGEKEPSSAVTKKKQERTEKTFSPLQFAGIAVALLAGYLIIKNTIGFTFIPEITASMGYGMLFVIGLLTSLHCVAMCGGINLSQCMPKGASPTAAKDKIKPSLLYNLGRVVSYTIIGGLIGALGSVFSFSGRARGAVAILAGVFMVIMGISMLGIFPWLNKFTPRIPRFLRKKAGAAGKGKGPFIVGLLNGLMPCGPLQAMQIYALGTGSFLTGAMSMFFFSLGTLPLMFGLGVFIMFLGSRFTKWMVGIGAVLVVVLGIIMFTRGAALAGFGIPKLAWNSSTPVTTSQPEDSGDKETPVFASIETSASAAAGDIQYITSELEANSYPDITVQKGVPVEWNLHAGKGTVNGCNGTLVISAYGIQAKLKEGDNLIKFTPTETGTITYSCWMGMITAQIIVEESAALSSGQIQTNTADQTVPTLSQAPGEASQETLAPGSCCAG